MGGDNTDADVLVVGAGPTGLLAAVCLRLHGVERVRIVDALDTPSRWAKAVGLQPRSVEILRQIGGTVRDDLFDHGSLASRLVIADYDKEFEPLVRAEFHPNGETGKSSGILLNEQWHNEEVLTKRLRELGVKVERGKRVESYRDTGKFVKVALRCKGSEGGNKVETEERINARYVVGCDGAHSVTRKHLGIAFKGERFPRSYALVHAMVDDFPMDRQTIRIDLGRKGWIFTSPMADGSWIVVFDLSDEERAACSPDRPSLEDFHRLLSERGIGVDRKKIHSPQWQSYFNVHSRQAERYSVGRIFLCGDAAHIHSPLGGQGMNMGLQDAHNLAWKLALVVRGEAGESLLDSYDSERHSVDRDVLALVETMHANVTKRDPAYVLVRNNAMRAISSVQFIVEAIALPTLGQTAYSYRFSKLSVESWGRVPFPRHPLKRRSQNLLRVFGRRIKAGDRVPDFDLNLIDISGHTLDGEFRAVQREEKQTSLHRWDASGGKGFKVLIFDGLPTHKLKSDKDDTSAFAMSLLRASQGVITRAVVIPVDSDIYNKFGVHGQCLMLIRPDGYVGLRQEPLCINSTLSYLAETIKATQVRSHGIICATGQDPAAGIILSSLLCALGYVGYNAWMGIATASTYGIGAFLTGFGAITFREVRRDWK